MHPASTPQPDYVLNAELTGGVIESFRGKYAVCVQASPTKLVIEGVDARASWDVVLVLEPASGPGDYSLDPPKRFVELDSTDPSNKLILFSVSGTARLRQSGSDIAGTFSAAVPGRSGIGPVSVSASFLCPGITLP